MLLAFLKLRTPPTSEVIALSGGGVVLAQAFAHLSAEGSSRDLSAMTLAPSGTVGGASRTSLASTGVISGALSWWWQSPFLRWLFGWLFNLR